MLNPNSEVYTTPSPTMPRDLHGRRGRNILEPKRVGEIRAEDISTPQGLCVHRQGLQMFQPATTQQKGEQVSLKPPHPAEELLLPDCCLEKKKYIFYHGGTHTQE